jgi:hypothetical protein
MGLLFDEDFDASGHVRCSRGARRDGLKSRRRDVCGRDALLDEKGEHGLGAVFCHRCLLGCIAKGIRMAADDEAESGARGQ